MLGRTVAATALASLSVLLGAPASLQADPVTVSLSVDPAELEGQWTSGEVIEVRVFAASDGGPDQGVGGADFQQDDGWGIAVSDTSLVRIHDVLYNGATQVDAESAADAFDGLGTPPYAKLEDTWVYEEFEDLTFDVEVSEGRFEAIPSIFPGGPTDLGLDGPVEMLHLAFEIQPGFNTVGQTATVTFAGKVGATNASDIRAGIFGQLSGNETGTGSFDLTYVPEPLSASFLAVAMVWLAARRRDRRGCS